MAFAPLSTYHGPQGDGSILGQFQETEFNNMFEFSENRTGIYPEFQHLVWCGPTGEEFRYANVKKTVAYVLIDEGVVEKWSIKRYRAYPKPFK